MPKNNQLRRLYRVGCYTYFLTFYKKRSLLKKYKEVFKIKIEYYIKWSQLNTTQGL